MPGYQEYSSKVRLRPCLHNSQETDGGSVKLSVLRARTDTQHVRQCLVSCYTTPYYKEGGGGTYSTPYTTVYVLSPPPGDGFPSPIARQPIGCQCQHRTIRLRVALGEMIPPPTFLAPKRFKLWRYRPWKIGPGGCDKSDVHRRTRCLYLSLIHI